MRNGRVLRWCRLMGKRGETGNILCLVLVIMILLRRMVSPVSLLLLARVHSLLATSVDFFFALQWTFD